MKILAFPERYFERGELRQLRILAARQLIDEAIKAGYGKSPEDFTVRDIIFGDANSTDIADVYVKTATVAGQEEWMEAAADLTAGDLKQVTNLTYVVQPSKIIGIYGFQDYSIVKDLTGVRYKRGAETLLFVEPESMYLEATAALQPSWPAAMLLVDIDQQAMLTPGTLMWRDGEIVVIEQNHHTAAARQVIHYALICEHKGDKQNDTRARGGKGA